MTRLSRRLLLPSLLVTVIATAVGWFAWQRAEVKRRFREALTAFEQGDLQPSTTFVRDMNGQPDWESHVRLLRGAQALRSGRAETAMYEFAAVRGDGELRTPLLLLQGEALFNVGRFAESERMFHELVAEEPDHADAHRWLAAMYHQRGAMEDAQGELLKVTRIEPDHYLAWRLLGLLYQRDLANNVKSVECYQKALDRNPLEHDRAEIVRELAEALIFRRDYRSALTTLKQVAADDGRSLALEAECYWSLDQHEPARKHLDQALSHDPDDRFALLLNARFHMIDGKPEAAIRDLKRALEMDPNDFTSRLRLAVAYERLGDSEASQAELVKMNESKKLRTELTTMFVQAVKNPNDAVIRDQIAEYCMKLGQPKLAETWRRAADMSRQISQNDR
ncbi:MAG: tetratricopeptide repeat protein [Fuerstiella sp.]